MSKDVQSRMKIMTIQTTGAALSHLSRWTLPAAGMMLFSCAIPALAQVATGDILGSVKDTSGAIIAGAAVRLENTGTHEVRNFTTNSSGEYTFSALQPGTYAVTVVSPSFKTFKTSNVVVAASDRVRIDAALQAGSVDEQVEVTTTPSALQTDSTRR